MSFVYTSLVFEKTTAYVELALLEKFSAKLARVKNKF